MRLYRILRLMFLCGTLTRIFVRKLELRFLCQTIHSRLEEVERLVRLIGDAFAEKTERFEAVGFGTFNDMGFAIGPNGERLGPICWNCPLGITVYIDDRSPCLGLGVELRGNTLCIRQMQGVHGAEILKEIPDWPELLVRTCITHAENEGYAEVRVYKADQDFNFQAPDIVPRNDQTYQEMLEQHQNRMRRRYDRTANFLGFEKKKKYYVWTILQRA